MTIAEVEYASYVSSFVGIPYKWNSWDKESGLDCRTITVCFLRGLGYDIDIDGKDGQPMPSEQEIEEIAKDKDKIKRLTIRYTKGVMRKGEIIFQPPPSIDRRDKGEDDKDENIGFGSITDIQKNDIVMYETPELPHLGVYVGNNRLLAASKKYGSLLLKLSMFKESIILIVRPSHHNLSPGGVSRVG